MISTKVLMLAIGAVVLLLLVAVPTITFALGGGGRRRVVAHARSQNLAVQVAIGLLLAFLALAGLLAFGLIGRAAANARTGAAAGDCDCPPCCEEVAQGPSAAPVDDPGLPRDTQGAREVTH